MSDKAMSEQLKPCPFCGEKAELTEFGGYEVWCSECWGHVCPGSGELSDAVAEWNRRADSGEQ